MKERRKLKSSNSKEHQGLKSSGLECNKCEVACEEKGHFLANGLALLFHTKHTHLRLLQARQLVLFGFVDFQG